MESEIFVDYLIEAKGSEKFYRKYRAKGIDKTSAKVYSLAKYNVNKLPIKPEDKDIRKDPRFRGDKPKTQPNIQPKTQPDIQKRLSKYKKTKRLKKAGKVGAAVAAAGAGGYLAYRALRKRKENKSEEKNKKE